MIPLTERDLDVGMQRYMPNYAKLALKLFIPSHPPISQKFIGNAKMTISH